MRVPTHSALIVTVPEADGAVGPHRSRFDRAASWGVPAHVTVLFPFVAPADLTADAVRQAADAVARVPAFSATFGATAWFGEQVLFLAPSPADPFVALTTAVAAAFPDHPPYGGAHADIVPHLTIGHDAPVDILRAAEADVRPRLPLTAEIATVDLWQGRDELGSWQRVDVLALGPRSATAHPLQIAGAHDAEAPTASLPVSRVIFMCGPSGSGKTVYAQRLEAQGMARLSFDVEMWRRGITAIPLHPEMRAEIEADLRAQLLQLVADGRDVVLDFSFWSRRMRDEWRRVLAPTRIVPETVYLATDRDTVLRRLLDRRGTHSDDYVIPDDLAAQYFDHFEAPTPDEGPLTIVR